MKTVPLLLSMGADPNATGYYRQALESVLDAAVRRRNLGTIELLLSIGANINANTSRGTALHIAVRIKEHSIAEMLIGRGADVNLEDEYGETPSLFSNSQCRHPYGANAG
jgi:ankyrin repeat protein